jgi:hypothetical protein
VRRGSFETSENTSLPQYLQIVGCLEDINQAQNDIWVKIMLNQQQQEFRDKHTFPLSHFMPYDSKDVIIVRALTRGFSLLEFGRKNVPLCSIQ